ncbi:hypothetical protein [Seleniivibrio sp.]|uniref:hypothetical protein n=1 Tax=Seleniivibrio sp. TaxID=2898801 RepID=UPI0025CBDD77|nr:hypothetical protein [Seleniivibrio sp.]MCD8554193.1 hypothetical protein [Seleniivibrio sp.]
MKKQYKERTKGRRYAFEMMYRFSVNADENPKDISDSYWKSVEEESEDTKEFACSLFLGASAGVDTNDEIIKSFIREDWNYDRWVRWTEVFCVLPFMSFSEATLLFMRL